MPIELHEPTKTRLPVLRRRIIGEEAVCMLIDVPIQRDILKRDGDGVDRPVLKSNGKPKQELVVELLVLPGTTMAAGLGDEIGVPQPGDLVRMILKGGGFGQWIEAKKAHGGLQVGDVVLSNSTHGQAYDPNTFQPAGPKLLTQAEIDAIPRGRSVGVYGDLTLRRATPEEAPWVAKAEAAYHAKRQADAIEIDPAAEADIFGGDEPY